MSEVFDSSVALPQGLDAAALRRAIQYTENALNDRDLVDLYFEQANIFSAIVGMYATKALDSVSSFEKNRHSLDAQTRFPDLRRRGSSKPLRPNDCLECKASKRPWAIQSHYNHSGWYIIWRYLVDPTRTIKKGNYVVILRIDVIFLEESDWKYQGSRAGVGRGGRTHTFGVRRPASKLRKCAAFRYESVRLLGGKPVPVNGD